MRINHNIQALNAYRNLAANQLNTSKNLERLSSGLRINRAADDAAGLAISEKMRSQIRGLGMAERNALDAVSLIQTAEGALQETQSILQRMRELSVQAANSTYTDEDRNHIQSEIDQLKEEIDRISSAAEFNNIDLLDGSISEQFQTVQLDPNSNIDYDSTGVSSLTIPVNNLLDKDVKYTIDIKEVGVGTNNFKAVLMEDGNPGEELALTANGEFNFSNGISFNVNPGTTLAEGTVDFGIEPIELDFSLTFQIGANEGQTLKLGINGMSTEDLNVEAVSVQTSDAAGLAIAALDEAINKVSGERAKLGAIQNRLEHTMNNLQVTNENMVASESRIRDLDMAEEMTEFTKNNILNQAAQAMLAQSNQLPQGILQLLK
ncbi:flagellin [Bacillus fengqiuensis]|nr:flagellin [Bacillus fengqiuensis]